MESSPLDFLQSYFWTPLPCLHLLHPHFFFVITQIFFQNPPLFDHNPILSNYVVFLSWPFTKSWRDFSMPQYSSMRSQSTFSMALYDGDHGWSVGISMWDIPLLDNNAFSTYKEITIKNYYQRERIKKKLVYSP